MLVPVFGLSWFTIDDIGHGQQQSNILDAARTLGVTRCTSDEALISFITVYNVSVSRERIISGQ